MDGSRDDRLYRVLLDIFGGDGRGLLALVGRLPEGPRLRPLLPAPDQPLARIVDDTIHLLSRQDMIDAAFFAALLAHSPRRRGELVSIASAWDVSLDAPARPPAVARAPGKSMYIVLAALGIAIPGGMYALMAGVNHRESPPETSPGTPNTDEDLPPPEPPIDKVPEPSVNEAGREEETGGPAPPPPTPTRNSTRKPTLIPTLIPTPKTVLRAWKCAIRLPASEAVTRLQEDIVAGRWPLAKVGAWELPGTDKFLVRAAISAAQGQADAAAMDVRGLRGRGPFSPDRQACLDALNAGAI